VFSRNFGVWREAEGGRQKVFDVIFPRGTRLPGPGEQPLAVRRRYQPAHNVGHFRYLEAGHVDGTGQPAGDLTAWDEIWFPLDPALAGHENLATTVVTPSPIVASQEIEERYACDATGGLAVTINNLTAGYTREYNLGRWSGTQRAVAAPIRGRRGREPRRS
jgi:hypothetical protein